MTAIADAIRAKAGGGSSLTLDEMVSAINGIEVKPNGTATAFQLQIQGTTVITQNVKSSFTVTFTEPINMSNRDIRILGKESGSSDAVNIWNAANS